MLNALFKVSKQVSSTVANETQMVSFSALTTKPLACSVGLLCWNECSKILQNFPKKKDGNFDFPRLLSEKGLRYLLC